MSGAEGNGFGRRRFLAVGGGLAALAVTGCGSNTGRASSGSSSGGKPTLSQWYHQYGEPGTQQAVQKYAKEYPDATVTVQWSPGDYDKKTASALLTDGGPDVFEYGNGPSIDMIKGGQVVDLSDLLGDAKSDFTPSLISRLTYQGKLYGIPQVTDMQLLVYRKSVLSAAGVQPPQTVDELLAAAKKLTTDKMKGLFVGNDGGVGILGGPALWSAGLDYLKDDNTFGFDDPAAVESLRKLRELFTSKSLLLGAPTDWSDPSAFTQGLTAMQFTGLWTFPQIQKALGDDFGVLPWPKLNATTGAPSVPVGAYASSVSAKSKNVDAAKKFVKWLWVDQTDKQLDWAQSYGFHIPARKSLIDKADKLKSGPAADAAKFVNENGHAQTPLLWTPKSGTAYSDALNRIIKSGSDPATEIKAVKAVVEAELKRIAG
ncbi:multiple sugar transport system substrate-binding protein [Kribbella voronezhensis]|uniref:Multiple sugar transport system substrate-binding protein n=1 Tax=Kribbella voronezhensis TaxID=2512212 RepID=A0A4R7T8L8_9ACTN|nr:sugar ABC transporter substrate-binding protein [Kribbella voronezhensis]TDU88300.1 multiple sugar transport system substrate-binding protein [Kribbella voronezhensis]